jgi:hypothetical protein
MEQENIEAEAKKKNWLYIISPCVIAAAFSLFLIISSYLDLDNSGGWSFLGVIIFLPTLFITLGIDFFVKFLVKKKVLYVWLVESILILIMFFIFKTHIIV